jgi:hypothetical protein
MRAGQLRCRITIEAAVETQGADGAILQAWVKG